MSATHAAAHAGGAAGPGVRLGVKTAKDSPPAAASMQGGGPPHPTPRMPGMEGARLFAAVGTPLPPSLFPTDRRSPGSARSWWIPPLAPLATQSPAMSRKSTWVTQVSSGNGMPCHARAVQAAPAARQPASLLPRSARRAAQHAKMPSPRQSPLTGNRGGGPVGGAACPSSPAPGVCGGPPRHPLPRPLPLPPPYIRHLCPTTVPSQCALKSKTNRNASRIARARRPSSNVHRCGEAPRRADQTRGGALCARVSEDCG